ncbi:MAG TPA: tetratricopeptide repeat protein [Gemmataceae bacterium]|nr:tetratricopeptide repeat protein [Gemmataceae bacterium]
MAKKRKHHHSSVFSPADLLARIERARREGRFQQALELAKQLHKYEPTPTHLELLKEVYLGRSRQLRTEGKPRDALTVLEAARCLDETTPAWLERLAEEMAQCGGVPQALALSEKLADPAGVGRILAHVADAALQEESAGHDALPPALQADFDRVILAFQQVESGQDEAARETLQGIGLRSPFLEWKLLLRGLQAYGQNDNMRALENWQRLNAERVPARLAAPLRCQIDVAFRTAQPPASQAVLQKQLDRLQGSPLLAQLRILQASLADKHKLATAFRQAEALLPALRQEAPHLLPRLAACFYWAILDTGPDDVLRYQRVFGHPPDDPNFYRLHALAYEKGDDLTQAHRYWQQYEKEIANHPEKWPGEQGSHARALIWQRMGNNAASIPPRREQRRQPFGLFGEDEPEAPLNPSAEKCLQKSLELAPDQLETHEAFVRHHLEAKHASKAEKAARELLKHFPEHVPTLELLSDLRRKHGDYAQALDLAQQALKGNSLDRRLRRKVSDAYLLLARDHVEKGRFDEARQAFQAALDLNTGPDGSMILAHWAACEFKAGDAARAEELVQQALARTLAPVGVSYLLLTEVVRLKLPRALKTRFEQDLKVGLSEPTPAGAVFLTRILAGLQAGGVKYIGQKGHTQKVLSYIQKARNLDFSETQLEELCQNLLDLKAYPKARTLADLAEKKHPENPFFPYLHALTWIHAQGRRTPTWRVVPLLQTAQRLARARPPDERRDRMLEEIEKHLLELNPFGFDLLERLFGGMDMGGDEFDDDPDDW